MAHYPLNHHLRQPYRWLTAASGLYLTLFGILGIAFTWGDPFFHRGSDWVLGLRTNPAAAWLSTVLGLVVLAAALVGGNLHHRVNLVLGWGILGVAMTLMAMIQTDANVLNVSMVNIIVLTVLGLFVLVGGLYGKVGSDEESRHEREAGLLHG
ncbi:DUF4383 domain-containing protein [Actinoplanes friuliensis]|jgi:hypothetical protein|uniref:DUF4383 domain-containing protein n=1 Tax=Actinoplanes friuliensis DSM 7358 TaxID=1246995 RepID=U5WAP4_9ACTN|nr:DUF4383 domain-containing protein [Actinoplanes friuliensis]AGZ46209.1 hypothetical protein AFR_39775 [Actinoplanes friuliensis DSM 7358]